MLYAFVPILFIFLSIGVIIVIIVSKFPQLSSLDTSTLPAVKEAKVKEAIKYQRFSRGFEELTKKFKPFTKSINQFWQDLRSRFRGLAQSVQKKYHEVSEVTKGATPDASSNLPAQEPEPLLLEAEKIAEAGDFAQAEEKYLMVLKLDPKSIEAYRGLGRIYFDQDKYKQAKEVYEFMLKLNPGDDRAYNRLGRVAETEGNWPLAAKYFEVAARLNNRRAICFFDLGRAYKALNKPAAALRNFSKAVQLEPNNPKYLDQLVEMSIMAGDTDLAKETYDKLRLVNPDNQKLAEFKQRIEEMES